MGDQSRNDNSDSPGSANARANEPIRVSIVSRRSWRDNARSYSAGFVAILALGVSIWQGISSHQHNRLSVRPLLALTTSFSDESDPPGLFLRNMGTGPAIIEDAVLYLDGELA